jgi:MSHA biogenesis protein MshQ
MTSTNVPAPNYGKETTPQGVHLVPTLVLPSGGHNPALTIGGTSGGVIAGSEFGATGQVSDANGVATVTNLAWDEVGIISLNAIADNAGSNAYLTGGAVSGATTGTTGNIGRFIPDHFGSISSIITNRSDIGSGAGCTPASSFTYMGEPMNVNFSMSALSLTAGPVVTQNYAGAFAKIATTNWINYGVSDSIGLWAIPTNFTVRDWTCTKATISNATPSITTFVGCAGGTGTNPTGTTVSRAAGPRIAILGTPAAPAWNNGSGTFIADVKLERADAADGPYSTLNLGIAPQDTDGVVVSPFNLDTDNNGSNERALVTTAALRYGRMNITNAYGSELLDLPLNLTAQYWNGTSYVTNVNDSCTPLTAANYALANQTGGAGGITSSNMNIAGNFVGAGTMSSGTGTITLTKPNPTPTVKGSVDLSTAGTLGGYLPSTGTGHETFGIYKAGPVIYIREMF